MFASQPETVGTVTKRNIFKPAYVLHEMRGRAGLSKAAAGSDPAFESPGIHFTSGRVGHPVEVSAHFELDL